MADIYLTKTHEQSFLVGSCNKQERQRQMMSGCSLSLSTHQYHIFRTPVYFTDLPSSLCGFDQRTQKWFKTFLDINHLWFVLENRILYSNGIVKNSIGVVVLPFFKESKHFSSAYSAKNHVEMDKMHHHPVCGNKSTIKQVEWGISFTWIKKLLWFLC